MVILILPNVCIFRGWQSARHVGASAVSELVEPMSASSDGGYERPPASQNGLGRIVWPELKCWQQ